jgi:hypothetical protein
MPQIMPMQPSRLVLPVLISLGCGPSVGHHPDTSDAATRYAAAVCDALEACGCYSFFDSSAACEEEYAQRLQPLLALNLTFDSECFEQVLGSDELLDCETATQAPFATQCILLQGATSAGDSCNHYYGIAPPFQIDECAGDFVCRGGRCLTEEAVLPPASEGEICAYAEFGGLCPTEGEHLYCSEENTCLRQVGAGDPCTSPDGCFSVDLPGLFCAGLGGSPTGTCEVRRSLGDACDPRDADVCAYAFEAKAPGWCDPTDLICVADVAKVCSYAFQR